MIEWARKVESASTVSRSAYMLHPVPPVIFFRRPSFHTSFDLHFEEIMMQTRWNTLNQPQHLKKISPRAFSRPKGAPRRLLSINDLVPLMVLCNTTRSWRTGITSTRSKCVKETFWNLQAISYSQTHMTGLLWRICNVQLPNATANTIQLSKASYHIASAAVTRNFTETMAVCHIAIASMPTQFPWGIFFINVAVKQSFSTPREASHRNKIYPVSDGPLTSLSEDYIMHPTGPCILNTCFFPALSNYWVTFWRVFLELYFHSLSVIQLVWFRVLVDA